MIGGATNVYFPNKAHTEVTTSAEAFAEVYDFLNGEEPKTTQIVPQPPGQVEVGGRALIFPANTGNQGARVEIYLVDPGDGSARGGYPAARRHSRSGWLVRPVQRQRGKKHYEFAVVKPGERTGHYYPEPFERSNVSCGC